MIQSNRKNHTITDHTIKAALLFISCGFLIIEQSIAAPYLNPDSALGVQQRMLEAGQSTCTLLSTLYHHAQDLVVVETGENYKSLKKSRNHLMTLKDQCETLIPLITEPTLDSTQGERRAERVFQIHQRLYSHLEKFQSSPFLATAEMSESNITISHLYHNRVAQTLRDAYTLVDPATDPGHGLETDPEKYIARAQALYAQAFAHLDSLSAQACALNLEN